MMRFSPAVGRPLALVAVAAIGLSACSRDADDFRQAAEDFIESNDDAFIVEINETLQEGDDPPDADVSFVEASCEEPENIDVGTQYRCTATDSVDAIWEFDVEITGDDELTLIRSSRRN